MENLLQKKSWARRSASSLVSGQASKKPQSANHPADLQPIATAAELSAVAAEQPADATAEIDVRSLSAQKLIVTGKLSGRSLDLVASLSEDGSLSINGFNGTLPTALTSRSAGGQGVQIGGRRDGMSVSAVICPRPGGGLALTERRGNETYVSVGLQDRMVERLSIGLPVDMARLFKATMLYLIMRCAA